MIWSHLLTALRLGQLALFIYVCCLWARFFVELRRARRRLDESIAALEAIDPGPRDGELNKVLSAHLHALRTIRAEP